MRGPTFICPGAQKAGTTWLHQQLKAHPDFWMPPQKEVDYLAPFPNSRKKYSERIQKVRANVADKPNAQWRLKWWEYFTSDWALEKYPGLFDLAGEKFSGDVSPNYSTMSAEEIVRAAEIVPEAKIVILLRDPVERAWSHARHTVTRGPKNDLPEAERIEAMVTFATSKRCLANGDYLTIIRNWRAVFGDERVHIGFYDDLVEKPAEMINNILDFLDAPHVPAEQQAALREVANKGNSYSCPPELRQKLEECYKPMVMELQTLLDKKNLPIWASLDF